MFDKILKIPISCRVNPELKDALEREADELGLTTSLYLEDALQNRHLENEKHKVLEAEIVDLQEHIRSLEDKIHRLKDKKRGLKDRFEMVDEDCHRLNKTIQNLDGKIQPLRDLGISELSNKNLEELNQYFLQLEEKYPELSRIQLLRAALNRTVKNERAMFIIHTISGYSID